MQTDNVGVVQLAEDGDFAVNLGEAIGVGSEGVSADELDGNLRLLVCNWSLGL